MTDGIRKNRIGKQITGFRKRAGYFALCAVLLTLWPMRASAAPRLQDTGDKLVIVIDPGHGGENQGTIENGYEEKGMTMVTARAMYEELSLYEDVEVYLTRAGDRDLTLKERAEFAASVDADFLFSIHYNASASHELFGSEVWVSVFPPFNGYGYQFGRELLADLRGEGLFIRGVKSRKNSRGGNYYGIIRNAEDLGVPAVIIEHCHVDEARDEVFCDSTEELERFGRMDATAVARYFGLRSSVLGVDYSGYELADADAAFPAPRTEPDVTEPEMCSIQPKETDYGTGLLELTVTAADQETPILYYSYSLDGGLTYTPRQIWPQGDALTGTYPDTFDLELQIPSGERPTVILRAYNMYDLYTESNTYVSPGTYRYGDEEAVEAAGPAQVPEAGESDPADGEGEKSREKGEEIGLTALLEICLAAASVLFAVLLLWRAVGRIGRGRRRHQRRKEAGDSRDHKR